MNRNQFIRILCLIESFKTAIKNVHWNQTKNANKHSQLDEVIAFLNEFEDAFAEDGSITFGNIGLHEIVGEPIDYVDGTDLMNKLYRFSLKCKEVITGNTSVSETSETPQLAGMHSICDDFIHNMKIALYRYNMS